MSSFLKRATLWVVGFCCLVAVSLTEALPGGTDVDFQVLAAKEVVSVGRTTVSGNVGQLQKVKAARYSQQAIAGKKTVSGKAAKIALDSYRSTYNTQVHNSNAVTLPKTKLGSMQVLSPGVYRLSEEATLQGKLILDAGDQPGNASFTFHVKGKLTVAPEALVSFQNPARPAKVLWVVEGGAELGEHATLLGDLIASEEITLRAGAELQGRAISLNESIYLNNNLLALSSDLSVTISKGEDKNYVIGELVTLTVVVRNVGPADDSNVRVESTLHRNLSFESAIIPEGTYFNSATGIWRISSLKAGEEQQLVIRARATASGATWGTAGVEGTNIDNQLTNNSASETICVVLSDLGQISGPEFVCKGSTYTYSIPAVGGTYTWAFPADWQAASLNTSSNEITVIAGGISGDVSVTVNNVCGASPPVTLAVTVSEAVPPQPGPITGATEVCAGQEVIYSIAPVSGAESYSWTLPEGWTIVSGEGSTEIRVEAGEQGGEIEVKSVNVCGESNGSATQAITVLGSAPEAGPITGETLICPGNTSLEYSIDAVPGASSYTWAVPNGWVITAGQGTTRITVTVGVASGTVSVEAGNQCGDGPASTLEVTVQDELPEPGAIDGPERPCANTAGIIYSVQAVEGVTYTWEVPAGWAITNGQGTNSITVRTGSATGNISLKIENQCNISLEKTLAVSTEGTAPAAPGQVRGGGTLCTGSSFTLSIDPVSTATTYTWSVPSGWTITSGQGTTSVTVSAGAGANTGTATVVAGNSCGDSPQASTEIAVSSLAAIGEVRDLSSPCVGLAYEVAPVTGASGYTWSVPAGWTITSGQGTNKIEVTAGAGPGEISVVASDGICSTEAATLTPDLEMVGEVISIPNVFSPNNDGNNDTWEIANIRNYPDNEVTVLNRWGNEVYRAKAYSNNWTGGNLSEGTYYYLVRVKLCDGTDKMFKGYLTIVR